LRRLDGVIQITLDTEEQRATIYFGEPVTFDFGEVLDAAVDAAYTTVAIRLTAPATVKGEVATIEGTGQRFELLGSPDRADTFELVADVLDFETNTPRLAVQADE